jgi:RecG-like helicase
MSGPDFGEDAQPPGSRATTTDGFKLAEMDLQQRGAGDLGSESNAQSGAGRAMLFSVPLTAKLIESLMPHWA